MPKIETILGFDFGLRYIGVAVGQTLTRSAQALKSLEYRQELPWKEIDLLVKTWHPEALVVGLPLNLEGNEQSMSKAARAFGEALSKRYDLSVHWIDERLTTKAARSELFEQYGAKGLKKAAIDSLSAKIILEEWLFNF